MTMQPWKGPEGSEVWGLIFFLGFSSRVLGVLGGLGMFKEKTESTLIPLNK